MPFKDVIKFKEYQKQYRINNREKKRLSSREYYNQNKDNTSKKYTFSCDLTAWEK